MSITRCVCVYVEATARELAIGTRKPTGAHILCIMHTRARLARRFLSYRSSNRSSLMRIAFAADGEFMLGLCLCCIYIVSALLRNSQFRHIGHWPMRLLFAFTFTFAFALWNTINVLCAPLKAFYLEDCLILWLNHDFVCLQRFRNWKWSRTFSACV